MKNKHTLANKRKLDLKIVSLKDRIKKLDELPSIDVEELKNWTKQLEKIIPQELEQLQKQNDYHLHIAFLARKYKLSGTSNETSKIYTKWWQRLLNKITFGWYKPTTFWYKVKPVDKSKYITGIDPYTENGEGSMGATWDNIEKKYIINGK